MKDKEKTDKSIIELIIPISTRFLSFGRLFFSLQMAAVVETGQSLPDHSLPHTTHTKRYKQGPFQWKVSWAEEDGAPSKLPFSFLP